MFTLNVHVNDSLAYNRTTMADKGPCVSEFPSLCVSEILSFQDSEILSFRDSEFLRVKLF